MPVRPRVIARSRPKPAIFGAITRGRTERGGTESGRVSAEGDDAGDAQVIPRVSRVDALNREPE